MKRSILFLAGALLLLPLFGCALGTDHVKISYKPDTPRQKTGDGQVIYLAKAFNNRTTSGMAGMKRNSYGVVTGAPNGYIVYYDKSFARDVRPIPGLVGVKRNYGGAVMGQVALVDGQTIEGVVATAIADTLKCHNFIIKDVEELKNDYDAGKDARILYPRISNFWCDFFPGLLLIDVVSCVSVEMNIKINDTGRSVYKKEFSECAKCSGIAATESLFDESMNKGFKAAMDDFGQAVSSPDFKKALTSATTAPAE